MIQEEEFFDSEVGFTGNTLECFEFKNGQRGELKAKLNFDLFKFTFKYLPHDNKTPLGVI